MLRDPLTAAHSHHMAGLSFRLAKHFDCQNAALYYAGALTHDIGKLGMPDAVLKGKGILSEEERELLRQHVTDGYDLLRFHKMPPTMLDIVLYHHERFNGSGYLLGLSGQQIPLAGRIAAITDTYSALTSDRPYSKAVSHETAIAIMEKDAEQFDPKILEVFIHMSDFKRPN
ncbi:HD-GYP domain-containing protein [Paenibacillus sp. D51F]